MKKMNLFLQKIPAILSSKISILIYLFLFFYLVIWALLGEVVPLLKPYEPTDTAQLILGNYTNVLSALGASIAAGTGAAIHTHVKTLHKSHDELMQSVSDLHKKIDMLEQKLSDKSADVSTNSEKSVPNRTESEMDNRKN